MICTKCGREIADDSRFCTFCGENVEPKPASEPEVPKEPAAPEEPKVPEESAAPKESGVPTDAPASDASPTSPASAASEDVPQDFPPPSVASAAVPQNAPQSAPQPAPQGQPAPQSFPPPGTAPANAAQGFPPPGGPQPAPQSFPPPDAPQGTYQGAPQDAYQGAPTYQAAPPAPKKSKTGIIIAIIVVVLLLCGAVTVGGFLIYQGVMDSLDSPVINNSESHSIDDNGNSSSDSSSNDSRGINRAVGDDVLLDIDECTITLDLDSAWFDENLEFYQIECVVENRTNTTLGFWFDYDTRIDGVGEDELFIVIYSDNDDGLFLANTTSEGALAVFTLPSNGVIANLEGTLVVFEAETYEIIGEYPVKMARL